MNIAMLKPPAVMVKGIVTSMLLIILMSMAAYSPAAIIVLDNQGGVFNLYDDESIEMRGEVISVIGITAVPDENKSGTHRVTFMGRFSIDCQNNIFALSESIQPVDGKLMRIVIPESARDYQGLGEDTPIRAMRNIFCKRA
jgi:hypothetical protein